MTSGDFFVTGILIYVGQGISALANINQISFEFHLFEIKNPPLVFGRGIIDSQ